MMMKFDKKYSGYSNFEYNTLHTIKYSVFIIIFFFLLQIRFWADDKRLPLKCIDRLLIILDQLYLPDIESQFLGNLISLLLESCCTALDYDQNIFQYPLHNCEFEDYKLTLSWRAKNVATIPKYANI